MQKRQRHKRNQNRNTKKNQGIKRRTEKRRGTSEARNDSLIGDIVRDLLGEVDADNIESFREKIQLLTGLEDSENERPKDNLQGDTGGVHSY